MTTVRRTAETIRIHFIHEILDTVAVEIHGAMLQTRADTAGILIGMRAIHGTRVIREVHVIQVIGDRMLVITVPREARVVTTEALGEMIEVRHAMTVVRDETTVVHVEMTEARVGTTVVRVEMTVDRAEMTEVLVATTVALVEMIVALAEMIDEVTRADPVRAQGRGGSGDPRRNDRGPRIDSR